MTVTLRMIQEDVILQALEKRWPNGMTHLEARDTYGVMRLAAVIYSLRKRGVLINVKMITVPTRYGNGKTHVAEYALMRPK